MGTKRFIGSALQVVVTSMALLLSGCDTPTRVAMHNNPAVGAEGELADCQCLCETWPETQACGLDPDNINTVCSSHVDDLGLLECGEFVADSCETNRTWCLPDGEGDFVCGCGIVPPVVP